MTVWIARELMSHSDAATARKVAASSVAWYRARPQAERDASEERLAASWALDLTGSYAEAARMARTLVAEDSANVDYRGALAGERDSVRADSLDRWLAHRTDARAGWSAAFYRAHDAALARRSGDAVARVREAIEKGAWPMWIHIDRAISTLATDRETMFVIAPKK